MTTELSVAGAADSSGWQAVSRRLLIRTRVRVAAKLEEKLLFCIGSNDTIVKTRLPTIHLVRMKTSSLLRPQNILRFYLAILYIGALISARDLEFAVQSFLLFLAVSLGYFLPYLVQKARGIPSRMRLENASITVFILTLLLEQRVGLVWAVLLGLVTALIKMKFRFQGKPILNPAAAGLAVLTIFGMSATWWGVSFAPRFSELFISVAAFVTLPVAGYVAHKYHKLPIALALFGSFALASLVLFGSIPWIILLEGTLLFFALVMAVEPLTTPVVRNEQLAYGTSIGALLALFLWQSWLLPYCGPLLIVNAGYALYRWWKQKQMMAGIVANSNPSATPTGKV